MGGAKPPKVSAPPVMPTPDDDAIQAAKRKSLLEASARSGRASTMLSQNGASSPTNTLGS